MTSGESSTSFFKNLHDTLGAETEGLNATDDTPKWVEVAQTASAVADALYPRDPARRHEFLGKVLGFELTPPTPSHSPQPISLATM